MNFGLLLLRLLLATLLLGHSAMKLLGWFGGAGPDGTAVVFDHWGFVPARPMVILAGLTELAGATSIAAGLLTPVGCTMVVGAMVVAVVPTTAQGFWANRGGCELPLCYGALAAVIGFTGPGRWSLDHALGLTGLSGNAWGSAALALGVLAAAVPLLIRSRALSARQVRQGATT
jgi:putative oxidoreductase